MVQDYGNIPLTTWLSFIPLSGKVEHQVSFDTHANVGNVNNMIKFLRGIATR